MLIPKIPYLTPILCGISLTVGLYGGYKLTANYYDAKQAKVDEAVIEQLVLQASIDRKAINDLSLDKTTLQKAYADLGRKARETKLTNSKCTVTDDAIRLRNKSLLGEEVLPGSSSGVDATRGSNPIGIDFTDYFQNDLKNDEKCNLNRKKINRMYEWCVNTFGVERCSGKD